MTPKEQPWSLAQYRNYLRLLAEPLKPLLHAKLDPSDLVQETLLKAQGNLAQFRGNTEDERKAWLGKILQNIAIDKNRALTGAERDVRREQAVVQALHDSAANLDGWLPAAGDSPSQDAIKQEETDRLRKALDQLPSDQREAVELHYFHACKVKEISTRMKRSENAVGGLLRRGMEKLRQLLDHSE